MNNFQKLLKNGSGLGTFTKDDLLKEISQRDHTRNVFPLDVFHEKVKPFINGLNKIYDIPASFIGLSLLSCYSTSVGTAYIVTTNGRNKIYLPVWAALVGMSSSGKSIALDNIFGPLEAIQAKMDIQWEQKTSGLTLEEINRSKIDTVIYRDAHIPTLVKSVLPDNPKGVLKMCDEILEWTNGMNQLGKKEGMDEQFWLSSWNCAKYSGIRSGKQKFVVRRPFVNVMGGIQYQLLFKLFARDRDASGFIFRLLFALPDIDKIAEPDPAQDIPEEWHATHKQTIERLYFDLPVYDAEDEPKQCVLTPEAIKQYQIWTKAKIKSINEIEDIQEKDIQAGILGKIKEYALRFAAILHLADKAMNPQYGNDCYTPFKQQESISAEVLQRALKLADYFCTSAVDVYKRVQDSTTAPMSVIIAANLVKRGKSLADIAEALYNNRANKFRMKVSRELKRWIRDYPRVFQSIAK
jgi:hypothetical protein